MRTAGLLDFDPDVHLTYNEDGVLEFTEEGAKYEQYARGWYRMKNDDSTDMTGAGAWSPGYGNR